MTPTLRVRSWVSRVAEGLGALQGTGHSRAIDLENDLDNVTWLSAWTHALQLTLFATKASF